MAGMNKSKVRAGTASLRRFALLGGEGRGRLFLQGGRHGRPLRNRVCAGLPQEVAGAECKGEVVRLARCPLFLETGAARHGRRCGALCRRHRPASQAVRVAEVALPLRLRREHV